MSLTISTPAFSSRRLHGDASSWLTVECLPTAHVWVEIGAERTEHLLQMVEVVIRPLDHVLIQCDAAVPRVDANVRTRSQRECAQTRELLARSRAHS